MAKLFGRFAPLCYRVTLNSALSILACLTLAEAARADADRSLSQSEALGLISIVNIDVSDDVSDGCWTNVSTVEAKMRLLFEQNDIEVEKDSLAFLMPAARSVSLSALGFRNGMGCVVSAAFEVRHWTSSDVGGYEELPEFSVSGLVVSYSRQYVGTNSSNMNQQLLDFFDATATNFVADILSARRSDVVRLFKNTYPHYGQEIPTQKEWEEYLSDFSSRN